jgi:glycosyltransferase involved in cell wall biosynthesis
MSSGIPIVCSEKDPMPEFLKNNGFYFDAHNIESIVTTMKFFLNSPEKRFINSKNALIESFKYTWDDTNTKIIEFLIYNYQLSLKY